MSPFYVIPTYQSLLRNFPLLKKGDLLLTRIPIRPDNFHLIFDLQCREVISFPSFLSQILSASKVAQAEILREFMPPYTYVIKNQVSLLQVMQNPPPYAGFITKKDQANCGLGVKLWRDLEELFNLAGTQALEFPFVLQPLFRDWKDLRVIVLGELYKEAYLRENPDNFRQNLFFGGKATPYELSEEETTFCKRVMERGGFFFAHLDLAYIEGKGPYLSEINLKGGIKGASIKPLEYEKILHRLREDFFNHWKEEHQPFEIL
ncbi:hypothetical protein THC_1036 [Caldimicrobium thiodismutans]|uniref:ATP-grasp fold RimK-type domain-containing protein n=1 Tax=Caldimicrobium thiodismutans TaxID=1653476 RepID=A0A0U4W2V7_9BACT|nr:hypothetical protein [Caldimicrobium thiodismutans]BAU23419.1 hypothetical protein THC_1036 [Caldimicrobium thiodismutans]